MRGTCEVNVAPFANGPDDPRYEPCGKLACTWERDEDGGKVWMCADHHDELMRPRRGPDFEESDSFLDDQV